MKASYPVAAVTVAALAVAGLSPVSAEDKAPTSTASATATVTTPPTPTATATPTATPHAPTSTATPDGPTPVTVTVTAPAVTATTTPFRATGPSSEFINKGILDERGKEIFAYINFAIAMLSGLLQAFALVLSASPDLQARLKSMLSRVGIKA